MLRLNDDERRMIESLAECQGLGLSDAMRLALRHEAQRLGIEPKAHSPRARKA